MDGGLFFSEKEVEKIFSVNVYSQYWTVFEFLPRMIRKPPSTSTKYLLIYSTLNGSFLLSHFGPTQKLGLVKNYLL
jgi:hypothetical protein